MDFSFLLPKFLMKIQEGYPQWGKKYTRGWKNFATFYQYIAMSRKRCKIGT